MAGGRDLLGQASADGAPRAVVVSQRDLWPYAYHTHPVEIEEVLHSLLGGDLVAMQRRPGRFVSGLADRGRARVLASKITRLSPYSLEQPLEGYDIAVFVVNNLKHLGMIQSLPGWSSIARRKVAFVSEIWPGMIPSAVRIIEEVVGELDLLVTTLECTVDELRRISGADVLHLPQSVDVLNVTVPQSVEGRRIDISNRGRRDPGQHAVFRRWATGSGGTYLFDTANIAEVDDHHEHRRHYNDQIGWSRLFVANYARFDQPGLSGGSVEFGLRYFEALAGGAVVVGQHPSSADQNRLVGPAPGWFHMPIGADHLPSEVADLLADAAEIDRLSRANRLVALARHDVLHRWDVVASRLGLGDAPGASARRALLETARRDLIDRAAPA
jgi:hypothetical protein